MTRTSIATLWIKKLKSRGIHAYKFNDLPEELKSLSAHRRAISEKLVEKSNMRSSAWRIIMRL